MYQEIKKRIEAIRNCDVPEGYQKTAFGIFPCDWIQVSLGAVSVKKGEYGLNAPACEYEEGLPKYLRITDIDEQGRYVDNNACVNDTDSHNYILHKGDIVFARTGASVGKNYIYDEKDGLLVYAGFLIKFSIKPQYNAYLICSNCRTKKYNNWVAKMCARSGQPGINAEEYATYSFIIPRSTQEQARIAEILMQWDKAIELQGKLVEAYQKLKKYCLNKMFPKKGSNVPEIRFPGFTAPWERRKFEDIAVRSASISSENGLPRVEYEDIISGTGRLNKDIFAEENDEAGIVFHKGDVLYGKLRPYLRNWFLPSFNGIAVGDFWVLKPQNADSIFLYNLIQSCQFEEVANQSTGTKMPRADWKLVSKTAFSIPSTIDEQSAIGTYFKQLDNLITLHQQKRDKLMAQRKILQQYLLTGIVRV